MIKTAETPTTTRKPDGIMKTQVNNQHLIIKMFFNHNSTDTFQDKLLRVILSEKKIE